MDVDFRRVMERCLAEIPPGRVATCGAVARALGDPRAARGVATWILEHPECPGAHRVVRADGRPILLHRSNRLTEEGILLSGNRVPLGLLIEHLEGVGILARLRKEQHRLAADVRDEDDDQGSGQLNRIAGADVSYWKERAYAAVVSVDPSTLEPIEVAAVQRRVEFPYIPSYLAYRELPILQEAVARLSERPDLLMVDGHGLLHPAGLGIASHIGVTLDLPTIGVAKHLLAGRVHPPSEKNDATPVLIDDRTRGYAWTPPGRSQAIYVSVGHRVSLERAMRIVRETTRQRYPEPLGIADRMSREMNKSEKRKKGAAR